MNNKRIYIVEPFGHRSGHYNHFTDEFLKSLMNFSIDKTIITFDGFNELISLNGTDLIKIKSKFKFVRFLDNRIHETISTLIYSLIYSRKDKNKLIYILDGSFYSLTLILSLLNNRDIIIYLHDIPLYLKTDLKPNLSLKSLIFYKIMWKKTKNLINNNNITFILSKSRALKKPRLTILSRLIISEWGIKNPEEFVTFNKKKFYTMFGPNHYGKDYTTVFKAIKQLNNNFPLLLAGKNVNPFNDINKTFPDLLHQKEINIVDKFIEEKDFNKIFSKTKFLILSYSKEFDAYPGIFNLALRYQIPVIISESVSFHFKIEEYNLGFIFNSVESLKKQLQLANDINELEYVKMCQNMKSYFEKYFINTTWEVINRKLLKTILN